MVQTQISLTNEMRESHQPPIYDLRQRTVTYLAISLPHPLRPRSFDGRMNRYGERRQIWTFRTAGRKGEFRSTMCIKIARTYAHLIGALRFRFWNISSRPPVSKQTKMLYRNSSPTCTNNAAYCNPPMPIQPIMPTLIYQDDLSIWGYSSG